MEKIAMWIAWHLPKRVLYWAYVRAMVDSTPDDQSPTSTTPRQVCDTLASK